MMPIKNYKQLCKSMSFKESKNCVNQGTFLPPAGTQEFENRSKLVPWHLSPRQQTYD
jgi:hypothetical protein